jgi:molybdopterin molybdotransferase
MELSEAQDKILRHVSDGAVENVPLGDAVGRVIVKALKSLRPLPHFNFSLMDGYAIGEPDNLPPIDSFSFEIIGELAAGCTDIPSLAAGEAVRIMTGAAVPTGATRVVPFEVCHAQGGRVQIPQPLPGKTFIRRLGAIMASGAVIIKAGEKVDICHLEALASSGYGTLPVFKRPEVRFFCTGSELVDIGTSPAIGQKISSNPYLLSALIQQAGGIAIDLGIVPDNPTALTKIMRQCRKEAETGAEPHIIISTGGMGPGKYDLTAAAFREMGGEIIYERLAIKSPPTLFGRLDNILYFALPGPPPAVGRLFPLLIGPAIRRFQRYEHDRMRGV